MAGSIMAVTGVQIAQDALKYVGHKYVYGGPSNAKTGFDCSSFVSLVLGHDLGMQIPGGSWASATDNGTAHGPVVADYISWNGATTIPNDQAQAGDLILYGPNTHCGIATSATRFVSAEDPQDGTGVAPMSAGPGAWITRRINNVVLTGGSAPVTLTSVLGGAGHTAAGVVISILTAGAEMLILAALAIAGLVVVFAVGRWLIMREIRKAV